MTTPHVIRVLKNTRANITLAQNRDHNITLHWSMMVFRQNVLCTIIPKNACSTMRFSIAKANGCVRDLNDINWIHSNNQTFMATTEAAAKARYTFIILRCPYARLFSAFMDKFVEMDVQAWQFSNTCDRRFHPHDVTFKMFINEIQKMPPARFDVHWRRQTDFLLYETYDDYFQFENLKDVIPVIEKKAGMDIIDTRNILGHGTAQYNQDKGVNLPNQVPALDLLLNKKKGFVPCAQEMFDAEMIAAIKRIYADDLALYESKFGKSYLMEIYS